MRRGTTRCPMRMDARQAATHWSTSNACILPVARAHPSSQGSLPACPHAPWHARPMHPKTLPSPAHARHHTHMRVRRTACVLVPSLGTNAPSARPEAAKMLLDTYTRTAPRCGLCASLALCARPAPHTHAPTTTTAAALDSLPDLRRCARAARQIPRAVRNHDRGVRVLPQDEGACVGGARTLHACALYACAHARTSTPPTVTALDPHPWRAHALTQRAHTQTHAYSLPLFSLTRACVGVHARPCMRARTRDHRCRRPPLSPSTRVDRSQCAHNQPTNQSTSVNCCPQPHAPATYFY
jgi:hypothetical protein